MKRQFTVSIETDKDILSARQLGRAMAQDLGLSGGDQTVIATFISELARNIVLYARPGEVTLSETEMNGRRGMTVVAQDHGPGIPDLELAMTLGYSTSKSLGMGLPGVRALADRFEIESKLGSGTTVRVWKWKG